MLTRKGEVENEAEVADKTEEEIFSSFSLRSSSEMITEVIKCEHWKMNSPVKQ